MHNVFLFIDLVGVKGHKENGSNGQNLNLSIFLCPTEKSPGSPGQDRLQWKHNRRQKTALNITTNIIQESDRIKPVFLKATAQPKFPTPGILK